jgi:hypothetical protein
MVLIFDTRDCLDLMLSYSIAFSRPFFPSDSYYCALLAINESSSSSWSFHLFYLGMEPLHPRISAFATSKNTEFT